MVRMHFRLYQNVSRENISDAMTGLYNRKILTPELEQRLQKLVQSGSSVMFIAIDMDKLKQINDTLGHQEGDLAITLLAHEYNLVYFQKSHLLQILALVHTPNKRRETKLCI